MKKKLFTLCLLLFLFSCSSHDFDLNTPNQSFDNNGINNYDKAWDLVKDFSQRVNSSKTQTFNFSDVKIEKIEKSCMPVQFNDSLITSVRTRGGVTDLKENVDIYTFQFEKNGKKGFAIATDDPRISTVLAYVENGILADTANNYAAAFIYGNIKNVIISDLNKYYNDTLSAGILTKAVFQTWQLGPTLATKWDCATPYNNSYPTPNGTTCTSTVNGKYPASYTAIALAQCVAGYPNDPSLMLDLPTTLTNKYNVRAFASTPKIASNSPHVAKVAQFIREFDDSWTNGFTVFACGGLGSKTELRHANMGLANVGLTSDYYRYNGTSTRLPKFVEYIVKGLKFDCASVMAGYNSQLDRYAVWIIDGINGPVATDYSEYGDIFIHCNFMLGGYMDGWAKNFQSPKDNYDRYVLGMDYSYYLEGLHFRPVSPFINPGF